MGSSGSTAEQTRDGVRALIGRQERVGRWMPTVTRRYYTRWHMTADDSVPTGFVSVVRFPHDKTLSFDGFRLGISAWHPAREPDPSGATRLPLLKIDEISLARTLSRRDDPICQNSNPKSKSRDPVR